MSLRLNIGCGDAPTEGWLNYDNSPAVRLARWPIVISLLRTIGLIDQGNAKFAGFCRARAIRYADATSRIPHPDGSVDVIYSSHMIEHLDRREARRFLRECRRALKPEGILRIAVPDLRISVSDYVTKGNAEVLLDHLQLALDKPRGVIGILRNALVGDRNHHWLYDGPSLKRLIEESGFDRVEILQPGRTSIDQPGDLDLFERAGESAYVEAFRGR
jgi:predicted SAM-dependent methyltransferase